MLPADACTSNTSAKCLLPNCSTGTIPEFSPSGRLNYFSASFNLLTGPVPSSIYNANIEHISLWFNALNGTVAQEIGKSEKLLWLDFESNRLTGTIPNEVGLMSNLQNLYWSSNMLTGTIPTEFGLVTRLEQLWFNNNQLTGTVPTELAQLSSLEWLTVQDNNLNGTLAAMCEPESIRWTIEADCGGDDPAVDCPCCVVCCDNISGHCTIDTLADCNVDKQIFELEGGRHYFPGIGTECECSTNENNEVVMSCSDTACQSCNQDGTVCSVNQDYSFTYYENSVRWREAKYSFQYVVGLNDTVTLTSSAPSEDIATFDSCEAMVNGEVCSSCFYRTCLNADEGAWEVNCENVEGAGRVDVCDQDPEDDGPLTVFSLQDPSLLQGCPPRMIKL